MTESSVYHDRLEGFSYRNFRLLPMTPDWAAQFGGRLARIDPWLKLGYSSPALCRYLGATGQGRHTIAVLADEAPAACLSVRPNWLRGPLLELLAVLPEFQACGLGKEIIRWLAEQSTAQGNLWTVSSEFNLSALEFYRLQGFKIVGTLPDLICANETEILLRLRLDN